MGQARVWRSSLEETDRVDRPSSCPPESANVSETDPKWLLSSYFSATRDHYYSSGEKFFETPQVLKQNQWNWFLAGRKEATSHGDKYSEGESDLEVI